MKIDKYTLEMYKNYVRILIVGLMYLLGYFLTSLILIPLPSFIYPPLIKTLFFFLVATTIVMTIIKSKTKKHMLENILLYSVLPGVITIAASGLLYLLLVLVHLPEWLVHAGLIALAISLGFYYIVRAVINWRQRQ